MNKLSPATNSSRFCALPITRSHQHRQAPRQGTVMVIVIVTLLIMTGIVAQLMRQAVSARRQTRTELEYRQTSLLADAGIQRALAARQNNADYQGETWNVPEGIIHQTKTGRVTIEVSEQQIQAVAVYPANSDTPLRFTRTQKVAP